MSKTAVLQIRLTPETKAKWETEAAEQGVTVSELVHQRMNRPWTSPMKGVDHRNIIESPTCPVCRSGHKPGTPCEVAPRKS